MRSARATLPFPPLQLITGEWRDAADLERRIAAALCGGIRWVQLRSKTRSARDLFDAAVTVAAMLREAGGNFVVNDRIDAALAAGANGVHLPESGISASDARSLLGPGAWIACSVHSVDAAGSADPTSVDAIQIGPIFETASKREFGPPLGVATLRRAAAAARERGIAVCAVGGIRGERIGECIEAGADAVSTIGAIWDAEDVEHAAREALRELRSARVRRNA